MWDQCKSWVHDAIITMTLFLGVPIVFIWTGEITITISPKVYLVAGAYIVYVFNCVFTKDIWRGIFAMIDIIRNKTIKQLLFIHNIESSKALFCIQRNGLYTGRNIMQCVGKNKQTITLVSLKMDNNINCINQLYSVVYLPLSKIVLTISPVRS